MPQAHQSDVCRACWGVTVEAVVEMVVVVVEVVVAVVVVVEAVVEVVVDVLAMVPRAQPWYWCACIAPYPALGLLSRALRGVPEHFESPAHTEAHKG